MDNQEEAGLRKFFFFFLLNGFWAPVINLLLIQRQ